MNAKEILARKFEKATFNGYKTEDVDEFLREISAEYSQLQKDKNELERKLEVLADKIREYRSDEDALKDALLIAQKQANQITSEAKAAAEKLQKETDEKIAKQLKEAQEKSDKLHNEADEYSKRMTRESNERADKLVKDAREKAREINDDLQRQIDTQQAIISKTRKEADEYRNRLIASYKAHMEFVEKLPEKCENEFIKLAAEEAEKRAEERAKEEAAKKKAADAAKPKNDVKEVKKEEPKSEPKKEEPAKAEDKEDNAKTGEFPFFDINSASKKHK